MRHHDECFSQVEIHISFTSDYQRVTDWPVGLCLSFTIGLWPSILAWAPTRISIQCRTCAWMELNTSDKVIQPATHAHVVFSLFTLPPDSSLPTSAENSQACPRKKGRHQWTEMEKNSHELWDQFNPSSCVVVFRLRRICEIYSKVLGTDEALHVSLGAEWYTVMWILWNHLTDCSCVCLFPAAGALWGEELVWRGVLWRLLHSLFPPRNPYSVWQVSLSLTHVHTQKNKQKYESVIFSFQLTS